MKEQVLNLKELLLEAECRIKEMIESEEEKEQLLSDMQASAIVIGNEIEKLEGEGTRAVTCLEEYCELLYQCSISDSKATALEIYGRILDKSQEFQKLFKEIAQKKEIVFFPYKASMWDSLESIWLAAKNNPEYRVRVVPIPYYDKNKDGSFGQQHYEGAEFPDYVPITPWGEYQIAERNPDIVFIHNPYDNGNYVSSVHPDYYAKNLKKHTEMLVYIPYFVMGEDIHENFCVCAGTIHAHKVILQSDKVRAGYVSCFRKFVKANHLEVLFPDQVIEEKFVALGSPKIDKALNCKKELFYIPEGWKKLLNGRKAVLYNTGLSGILNGNEQELEKIEDVIKSFRQREDVVLWWRPHPMSENMFASLRPQLYKKYEELVEIYKRENIGIYDDTPDLYRAVTYTDMYYGDESSLIYLYGVQGKPVVIQNIACIQHGVEKQVDRSICFDRCVYEDGKIWYVPNNYNALFQTDVETGVTCYLGKISNEIKANHQLYSNIFKLGEELWLIPYTAREVAKYNLKTGKFTKYCVKKGANDSIPPYILYSFVYEKNIYMISANYENMYKLNIDTGSVKKTSNLLEQAHSINEKVLCSFGIFPTTCLVEDSFYFVISGTNCIMEYQAKNEIIVSHVVGNETNRFTHICYDGKYFWLAYYGKGNLIRWNKKRDDVVEISGNIVYENIEFVMDIYCDGEYVVLLPEFGKEIIRIEREDINITRIKIGEGKYGCFFAKKVDNKHILFSIRNNHTRHQLALIKDFVDIEKLKFVEEPEGYCYNSGNEFLKLNNELYQSVFGYYVYESREINIDVLLEEMMSTQGPFEKEKECFMKLFINSRESAGENILNNIIWAQEKKWNDIKK